MIHYDSIPCAVLVPSPKLITLLRGINTQEGQMKRNIGFNILAPCHR